MSKQPDKIQIPPSNSICSVHLVDAKCDAACNPLTFIEPVIPGHTWLNLPTNVFYIKHESSGQEILFDLGMRKDWRNSVPTVVDLCSGLIPGVKIDDDVPGILRKGGVDIANIKTMILSHWHFDHCGDPSLLNKSTDILVGPGFKDAFLPGYPGNEESVMWESAFEGRNVIEVSFTDEFQIGGLAAHDFFGDGSLYIIDTPGHAVGHISALVRTTPDTFVFLGGDICHVTSMMRPSEYIPLPITLPIETARASHIPECCPTSAWTACHPNQDHPTTTPFFGPSSREDSFYSDPSSARATLLKIQHFDADENILILVSHDPAPRETLPVFPNGDLNDWREKAYDKKIQWSFVNELPYEGKQRVPPLVDGLYDCGEKIRGLKIPKDE